MAEPAKNQTGDGRDNYGQAAKQTANAIKEIGKSSAKQAAAKGAEATANAAASTAKAGLKTGKAVSEIAAGTAAGGPWGAIISAAWSMRHTLFKVLIAICLVIVFIVVTAISLPAIIFESIFGLPDEYSGDSFHAAYAELSSCVSNTVDEGYNYALGKVDTIIAEGGYDYKYSMDAMTDNANGNADYDVCYVLAMYSASMGQKGASADNMVSKMRNVLDQMFVVTFEECEIEIPILSDLLEIIGMKIVRFVKCVIHPFNANFFLSAFNVDLNAKYGEFDITYGEAIDFMAQAMKLTLNGGSAVSETEVKNGREKLSNHVCDPRKLYGFREDTRRYARIAECV